MKQVHLNEEDLLWNDAKEEKQGIYTQKEET